MLKHEFDVMHSILNSAEFVRSKLNLKRRKRGEQRRGRVLKSFLEGDMSS